MTNLLRIILLLSGKIIPLLIIFISATVKGQYRELIYYKIPVGAIHYFHPDDEVYFKLRSENKFDVRHGFIKSISDTVYEIGSVRFRPENLKWISPRPSKTFVVLKSVAGSLILVSGLATVAYGFSSFPDDAMRKKDPDKFHSDNIKAIDYCLGGLVLAALSIPVYGLHPRRYAITKRWKMKYQH